MMFGIKLEPYLKTQSLIVANLYIGQILAGYCFGYSASALPKLKDAEQSPLPGLITDQKAYWIVSFYFIGGIIGPYTTTFLSNVYGRKPCLFLGGFITSASYITLALADNLPTLYAGRFFCGLGMAIIIVLHLVYIGEITSTSIRGVFLILTGIFYFIGILIIFALAPFMSFAVLNYVGLAISLIYMAGLLKIPETPLFLILSNNENKAKEVLRYLNRDEDFESILSHKTDIESQPKGYSEIFAVKSNRKAFFITVSLQILRNFSGILIMLSFATTIFELTNSSINPYLSSMIVAVTQIFAGGIAPFFVEKSGRKSLLLWSSALSFFSMALLATYFYLDEIKSPVVHSIYWLPLLSVISYMTSSAFGLEIIPSTFIGEMFTANTRSFGATLTVTIGWIWTFGMSSIFSYILQLGTHVPFWIFAVGCAVTFIFTLAYVPETKGKSLLEVQEMLSR